MVPVRRLRLVAFASVSVLASCSAAQPCVDGWIAFNPWIDDPVGPIIRDVNAIARWDPDGPGPRHELIVIGGRFVTPGTFPISGIAAWDPVARHWLRLGGGVDTSGVTAEGVVGSGVIYSLAAMPDGRLFAGGVFSRIGDLATNNIAQFDSATWKPLDRGTKSGESEAVRVLMPMPDGSVIAGGGFGSIYVSEIAAYRNVNGIAKWNGESFAELYRGVGSMTSSAVLGLLPNGADGFYVCGSFRSSNYPRLARWDGTNFNWVANINDTVTSLARGPGGEIVIAGAFTTIDGGSIHKLATSAGSEWSALPTSLPGLISRARVLGNLPDQSIIISINDTTLARWDGVRLDAWNDAPPLASPKAMLALADGGVWLGNSGSRSSPSDARFNGIALLDGSAWKPLQDLDTLGPNAAVEAILPRADGTFLVCGQFSIVAGQSCNIAAYNGTSWTPLASVDLAINAACKGPGDSFIIVGTRRATSPSNVYRVEDGIATPLGSGTDGPIFAVDVTPSGDVIIGGRFTQAGGVNAPNLARWDGSAWHSLPPGTNGPVFAIKALPDGDIIVGGSFNVIGANFSGQGIMRLRDGAASAMGTGLGPTALVHAIRIASSGDLLAAGLISRASGDHFDSIARWTGASWEAVTPSTAPYGLVQAIEFDGQGRLLLAGRFTTAHGKPADGVLRLDGEVWRPLPGSVNGLVNALAYSPTLGLLVGGSSAFSDDIATPYFARYACRLTTCPLDFDTDGILSVADFFAFVDKFNDGDPATDFNQDDALSFEDFDAFVAAYSSGC